MTLLLGGHYCNSWDCALRDLESGLRWNDCTEASSASHSFLWKGPLCLYGDDLSQLVCLSSHPSSDGSKSSSICCHSEPGFGYFQAQLPCCILCGAALRPRRDCSSFSMLELSCCWGPIESNANSCILGIALVPSSLPCPQPNGSFFQRSSGGTVSSILNLLSH